MSLSELLTLAVMITPARIAPGATSPPTAGVDVRGVVAQDGPGAVGTADLRVQSVHARRRVADTALAGALVTRGASVMPARPRAPAGPDPLLRGTLRPVAQVACSKALPCHQPVPCMMARAAMMTAA